MIPAHDAASALVPLPPGGRPMPFLIRIMLALGGGVAAWFLSPDAPNFAVMQGMLAIGITALILVVLSLFSKW